MAIATLTTPNLRIISLRDADIDCLEHLFDEQCSEWRELLRWDYSGPSALIRDVARQRELPGLAITTGNEIAGCGFWVIEQGRCSIGDVYVARKWRRARVDYTLAAAILDQLDSEHGFRRIESQCVNVGSEGVSEVFVSRGFQRFIRHYMMNDLASGATITSQRRLSPRSAFVDVEIKSWDEAVFDRAAQIIYRSYRDEDDRLINSQYRTEHGCGELLSVLTGHVWCGEFLPHVSRIATSRVGDRPIGVLIALRIAPGIGHIGQISILPEYQGMGVGRRLIGAAICEFRRLNFDAVSLAVTASNHRALSLYRSCGFKDLHCFPVFYKER
ncbi:MAG TPA: GNAT family N-acetyltransferase [Blastocatellia bacterium]|nr:GNAT family N-acetyltransferase [Blastocatellia bacterium]